MLSVDVPLPPTVRPAQAVAFSTSAAPSCTLVMVTVAEARVALSTAVTVTPASTANAPPPPGQAGVARGGVRRSQWRCVVGRSAGVGPVVGDEGDDARRGVGVLVGVVVGHRLQAGLVGGERLGAADVERRGAAAAHRQAGAGS